jgi:hypothetical protein
VDNFFDFFIKKLEQVGLLHIEPAKLTPIWTNKRTRVARIVVHLDCFSVSKDFLEKALRICQWVSIGGDSNQKLLLLEVDLAQGNPPRTFKLNPKWLKEENFIQKTKDSWIPFYDTLNE